ncbi:C40 family peptidase [Corynebacterium qintianiae]|uniref:C40 family peptidase n=1 Tax=Corynebacterium qintianiae TaxID=2709392 RepID=A0A7T0PE40_9CORY|nr:NlpC/P60 family protein [Corynebacterium qintianiae]QPK82380.1 C40 family peptidase [Corynebacterium qintianiae]
MATSAVACSTTLSVLWVASSAAVAPANAQDPVQDLGASAAALVGAISTSQGRIDQLDVAIGDLRESVNQALVDLHDAQALAEQARRGAEEAQRRLEQSQRDVEAARRDLAGLTRTQYRSQGSPSALEGLGSSSAQRDVLDRSLFLRQQAAAKQARLDDVERSRAEAANEESRLRLASERATRTASEAKEAEAQARAALDASQAELEVQLTARDAAVAEQTSAQRQLEDVRPGAAPAAEPSVSETAAERHPGDIVDDQAIAAVESTVAEVAPEAPAPSTEQVTQAVETALRLRSTESAAETSNEATATATAETSQESQEPVAGEASSDDVTAQAASIAAAAALVGSSQAAHGTFDNPYGSSDSEVIAAFSSGLSSVLAAAQAHTPTPEVEDVLPDVSTSEDVTDAIKDTLPAAPNSSQVETVIARAQAMVGTPYVWGGGDANGPTTGVNGDSQKGFDCSGLVLYAFAGAGVSLPHYTGYQYQRGKQIDPHNAQRGDLFFWGNNGDSHVAIYLGDGTMIEAPSSGQTVRVTPVRWSGMSPKAVRLL